jgi:hypothetical protein
LKKSVQELLLVKIKSELWSSFEELGGNLLNLLTSSLTIEQNKLERFSPASFFIGPDSFVAPIYG